MSLLGRLEDLSLTDIIQIVYLSRRTGILEIINHDGRHTVLFHHGLVVNASSPSHPDLVSFLHAAQLLSRENAAMVVKMEDRGIPPGTAVMEMNLLSADDLADAVRQRVMNVVGPLLQSKEGEFNFILSDSMTALDLEYEPERLFRDGGLAPNKLMGTGDGEKLKPLRGLEESMKAGKALLRGSTSEAAPAPLDLGLKEPAPQQERERGNVVPFPSAPEASTFTPIEEPFPEEALPALEPGLLPEPESEPPLPEPRSAPAGATPPAAGQFKVAGGLFEIESPDAAFRNVVLYERNPLIRVAARRAFGKRGVKIFQFGNLDDVRGAMRELFNSNSFFVTFLELDDASVKLMQQVKKKNPRLPVVMIDREADLRRRHDLLRGGADLYLTRPAESRMQPGVVEEELALFADELLLFCERSFAQWEQVTGGGIDAGRRFYEMASKETMERSFGLLRQLINELSNPNDINQVAATILRLSAEYVDRGALFVVRDTEFQGLGGFGVSGSGASMDERVRQIRIPRGDASILNDVASSLEPHRGKMRRTPSNEALINQMGGLLPTEIVALPIMHGEHALGILYGDNAEHRAPIESMTGLEIFLSQAGYAFGNAVLVSEGGGRT
jgi:hypothetical protein